MARPRIQIRMLGSFAILIDGNEALPQLKQAKKTSRLLQYLLLRYGEPVSHSELIDALWSDQERANPATALRTLLHRYRHMIQQSGITELADSIVSTRGYIQWNTELDCEVDIIEMERLFTAASQPDIALERRIELLGRALEWYHAPLLTDASEELWVISKSMRYHDMFLEHVMLLVELFKQQEDHNRIVQLCRRALEVDMYDEQLNIELMMALVKTGKKHEALSVYRLITDLHHQQMGVEPSENIRNLYKVITSADQSMEEDIEHIQESIEHEDDSSTAFSCEYEIFKEIYHLQRRLLERGSRNIFLGLVTLAPAYGQEVEPLVMDRVMKLLQKTLCGGLRRGDVVSRFSATQYVLLLCVQSYDIGRSVMERIKYQFYQRYVNSSLIVTYKLCPLRVHQFGQHKAANASNE